MAGLKEKLEGWVDDIFSLEVATITNATSNKVDLKRETPLTDQEKAALKKATDTRNQLRTELIAEIEQANPGSEDPVTSNKATIRQKRRALKEAEKQLDELEKAMGIYDPKDIFSSIRGKLTDSDKVNLVAYSRFEFEGDSINYLSSDPSVADVVQHHKDMVESAQASRKALIQTVISYVD